MPQTLSFNLVHIIFSTKDRRPVLNVTVRPDLHAYLATVSRNFGCDCFRVGGIADHVHIAANVHPTKSVANLVKELKTSSSIWLKTQGVRNFAWQRGYAAFSVSPADNGALMRYIDTQEAHHAKRDFQAEMRAFFAKYHMVVDEKYVWG